MSMRPSGPWWPHPVRPGSGRGSCMSNKDQFIMSERSLTTTFMPRSTGVKEKVERAAIELFAAKGVDGVSIGEIAALAGVSQGALYRHYPSKEDLAGSLFSAAYLRTGAELDAIAAGQLGLPGRIGA